MTAAGPKPATPRDDLDTLAALQTLPSIGPRLAEKLQLLGVRSPADLRGRDPEALYDELQTELGPVDRCVLYAFRCAVHAAEHAAPHDSDQGGDHGADDPELAKWWNWRDGGPALQRAQATPRERRGQAAAGRRRNSTPSRKL